MINVLHSVNGLEPKSGGTARIARDLTDTLSTVDDQLQVYLLSQHHTGAEIIKSSRKSRVVEFIEFSASESMLKMGLPFAKTLRGAFSKFKPDLIHDHGIWLPSNHYVAAAARRFRIPIVVHTHGMLEPWSLKYHGWRKRLALQLYQRRDLESAAVFFATADQEANSIRDLGLRQPIAVIPNGVDVVDRHSDATRTIVAERTHRNILYLGRIHPKKGLLNLIDALARVRPTAWRLCIAGPDEDGHLAEVLQKVRMLDLDPFVNYVGEVNSDGKRALFEKTDLFVLPSFSENFGVVVAESLAHRVPVIATRGTPWEDLKHYDCGWWIAPTVDALTETFVQALGMDQTDLRAMGERGLAYVKMYDWNTIAKQTIAVYRWVLGEGALPACVVQN